MIRWLIAWAVMAAPLPVLAQQKPADAPAAATQSWRQVDGRLLFGPASLSLPARAGIASVTETNEFSHQGENIDNIAQYRSPDGEVIATVYIYYPGLPHVGLASYATDQAIHLNSSSEVRSLGTRVVAAAGLPGTGLRSDYSNYRNGNASSAAFIKLDRWLIKLRVSAPERRRADVDSVMSALIANIRFEGVRPREATPLEVTDCGSQAQVAARLLPDEAAQVAADSLFATFDGAGMMARTEEGGVTPMPPRVPNHWCLSSRARIGDGSFPILRALGGQAGSVEGRSRLIAIISDAGGLIEVVEQPNSRRFLVLHHQVGETSLLGAFDAVPSDEQIAAIVSGADAVGGRRRARVRLRPGEGDRIDVAPPEEVTPEPST